MSLLRLGLLLIAVHAGASQNTCDPKQVWEEMILAKGGRARLEAVSALYTVESYGRWYSPGRTKRLLVLPDFYWSWHKSPPFFGVTQIDLARGMKWDCRGGGDFEPSPIKTSDWFDTLHLVYLFETKWLKPKPVACVIRMEGNQEVTSLQVGLGKIQAEFLMTAGSRLPGAVELSPNVSLPNFWFDRYKAVKGIMLPSRMSNGPKSHLFWTKVRYEIDPKYDPDFRNAEPRPRFANDDSEPWRPGRSRYDGVRSIYIPR